MTETFSKTFGLNNWNGFERAWAAVFIAAGTLVSTISKDSLLNYVILVTGILCVVLAAKGNVWNYVFGTVNSVGYGYVSYVNGLYGDMSLNFFFFLPAGIIGFIMWKNHLTDNMVRMRELEFSQKSFVALACIVLSLGLGYFLSKVKSQNTPYLDATSTILSIVATILMLLRYKEQWILYIILNVVTIAMWIVRLTSGSTDGGIMIIMWTAFLVNSFYGFYIWNQGASKIISRNVKA